jgi:atypical dual specificity phosphatase
MMDTWWIDKPHLLGSRNPTNTDLEQLRDAGFGVLVSLLCEEEQAPRYDIASIMALGYVRHNIAVQDFCAPTVEQLEEFVKLVDGLSPGTKMIVHCEGGTGRTGTFAAAYWVAHGRTVADAIKHVRKARHHAVETPGQERILEEFASKMQRGQETRDEQESYEKK